MIFSDMMIPAYHTCSVVPRRAAITHTTPSRGNFTQSSWIIVGFVLTLKKTRRMRCAKYSTLSTNTKTLPLYLTKRITFIIIVHGGGTVTYVKLFTGIGYPRHRLMVGVASAVFHQLCAVNSDSRRSNNSV